MNDGFRYFICYKPYGMLSQFSAAEGKHGLGELFPFPRSVYPVGRLDEDSEGLLLLTDDPSVNARMLGSGTEKEYWVQVEGTITDEAIKQLSEGVEINLKGRTYLTQLAQVVSIGEPADVAPRIPPVRFRMSIPTSWISMRIREGKNRQVRRMTAAVGFPTLRLIRVRFGPLELGALRPGEVQEISVRSLRDMEQ